MNKQFIFITLLLVISSAVVSQEISKQSYIPPKDSIQLKNNISIYKNIRYGAIPDSIKESSCDRILDLYLPQRPEGKKNLPVLVFVHGGGFQNGDKGATSDIFQKMASKGFAVVSINYRLTVKSLKEKGIVISGNTSVGPPADGKFQPLFQLAVKNASDDAVMALEWVKKNSGNFRFNLKSVSIAGGSAGGMTALYVAYASGQKVLPIHAVVDFWGGLENANVIQKGSAPVLIYHGDVDKSVNIGFAYAIQKRLNEIHDTKSVVNILKGKGHSQYKLISAEKIDEIVNFLNQE